MIKKYYMLLIGSLFLLCSLQATAKSRISLATGVSGGVYDKIGEALCKEFNNNASLSCQDIQTSGGTENISLLKNNSANIILVEEDTVYQAYNGEGSFFEKGRYNQVRQVLKIYPETFNVVVLNPALKSISDLKNKKVAISGLSAAYFFTTKIETQAIKWDSNEIKDFVVSYDLTNSYLKLCAQEIDAVIMVSGHVNPSSLEAFKNCNLRFMNISTGFFDILLKRYLFYFEAKIPAGLYRKGDKDVDTFGTYAMFASSSDVPNEVVYKFLENFFNNLESLKQANPSILFNLQTQVEKNNNAIAPYHDGALSYFRDKGWLK
ncbi:TAXI family TRAP transporter solute-binding subunit [Candidatus Hepatincolaceae symbiont of Richtersius coronifer]